MAKLVQTAVSASNSVNARIERWRCGRQIEAARVEIPLFILGHYRSGTTHLHNPLALDPQFAAPTLFQVFNPHTFLTTERLAAPVADSIIARRRYKDEMAQGAEMPSEDEFALCTMTGLSPYMAWCFPEPYEFIPRAERPEDHGVVANRPDFDVGIAETLAKLVAGDDRFGRIA
jgi:omega-hydroxy-beta-dihydromenaquinone-9 sulfotransferase